MNDASLPKSERQDVVDDLNEQGLPDPRHPTAEDIPMILRRLNILEHLAPNLPSDLESDEAISDLCKMGRVATGSKEKID